MFSWNYVIEKEIEENENRPQQPQEPQQPQQSQQPAKHSVIKTGDESSLLFYGMMMMSALGTGVAFYERQEH